MIRLSSFLILIVCLVFHEFSYSQGLPEGLEALTITESANGNKTYSIDIKVGNCLNSDTSSSVNGNVSKFRGSGIGYADHGRGGRSANGVPGGNTTVTLKYTDGNNNDNVTTVWTLIAGGGKGAKSDSSDGKNGFNETDRKGIAEVPENDSLYFDKIIPNNGGPSNDDELSNRNGKAKRGRGGGFDGDINKDDGTSIYYDGSTVGQGGSGGAHNLGGGFGKEGRATIWFIPG